MPHRRTSRRWVRHGAWMCGVSPTVSEVGCAPQPPGVGLPCLLLCRVFLYGAPPGGGRLELRPALVYTCGPGGVPSSPLSHRYRAAFRDRARQRRVETSLLLVVATQEGRRGQDPSRRASIRSPGCSSGRERVRRLPAACQSPTDLRSSRHTPAGQQKCVAQPNASHPSAGPESGATGFPALEPGVSPSVSGAATTTAVLLRGSRIQPDEFSTWLASLAGGHPTAACPVKDSTLTDEITHHFVEVSASHFRRGGDHFTQITSCHTLTSWRCRVQAHQPVLAILSDLEAAHENEPRLAVPSCHGRR